MKYLYFQDAHCKGVNPSSRLDDYYKSWMLKFREVLALAKEYKVKAIIDGGDLLDIPEVSTTLSDDILDAIEATGIEFWSLWGNHALIGHHHSTSNRTSMAHMLRRCKLLKDASGGCEVGTDYHIDFIDYEHNIEEKLKSDGIKIDSKESYWKVAVVHAFVTPKPFLEDVLHVQVKDIVTNADLVLVAHYHAAWKKQVGKTEYVDIGCMGRCKISEADIIPSVLILDTDKRNYEIIPLKSAKPGSEIFDLAKKEEVESNEKELERWINSLRDFQVQDTDLRGIIEFIGKDQKIDRAVIDRILAKLREIQERVK
jgi:DNA repair exonuclease SbcCD nuclease subunit